MSDLICRQDAYNLVKQYFRENYVIDGDWYADEIIRELEDLPSAEPRVEKWIPCSERLPVDDDYRESMECLDGCVWYFTDTGSMGLGYYYYSTKEWSTLRDLKPDGKVIAWMPLPKPYQEDKQ